MTSATGPRTRTRPARAVRPRLLAPVARRPGRGPHRARRGRHGLTLLELILVMALTLTILGAAAPRLDSFSRARVLRCQADALLALIQGARDRAAAQGATHRVEIDPQAKTFRLLKQQHGPFQRIDDAMGREFRLPEGVSVELERFDGSDDRACIDLAPTGACTPARIVLLDGRDNALYLVARSPLEPFVITDDPQEAQP